MFAGIYYGGMYGGSTTSILLNTPGESASIITALEGNKMARSGRGAAALATAAIGSLVALVTVSALLGSSVSRGLASLSIGLLFGLVGTDNLTGQQRFTFGLPVLGDGIDVVTFAVGVFAVGETLWVASRLRHGPLQIVPVGGSWMTRQDFRRSWRPWLRGTALGFPIGAMPAGGAE